MLSGRELNKETTAPRAHKGTRARTQAHAVHKKLTSLGSLCRAGPRTLRRSPVPSLRGGVHAKLVPVRGGRRTHKAECRTASSQPSFPESLPSSRRGDRTPPVDPGLPPRALGPRSPQIISGGSAAPSLARWDPWAPAEPPAEARGPSWRDVFGSATFWWYVIQLVTCASTSHRGNSHARRYAMGGAHTSWTTASNKQ